MLSDMQLLLDVTHIHSCIEQLKNPEKVQQASREDAAQLAKIRGPELEGSDKSADPELLKKVGPAATAGSIMTYCKHPSRCGFRYFSSQTAACHNRD